jgi:ATP-dependent DNA helicase RecQ
MINILKTIFGYVTFRPNQEEIIQNILKGRDVFAVMPTGGGKSLCYQLPAKMLDGTIIVISPLISLMKDQVDTAIELGFTASFINSSLSASESRNVYNTINGGSLELLYIAPERFIMEHFIDYLKTIKIALFAIDEAHCISQWGHDFRPDYLELSTIREKFPAVPIAAFTATATPKVSQDIVSRLNLKDPFTVRASFDRPNLFYRVEEKTNEKAQILEFLESHSGDQGIIYTSTRDSVDNITAFLNANGKFKAIPYHAGLPQKDRRNNQESFNKDEVNVIVATIAFGMGIDKSNIRFVLHASIPKNIEGYYQETGRAGRDGEPSECLLLFGRGDIVKNKYFIDMIQDEGEKEQAYKKLYKMIDYATHNVCRRKAILKYFDEEYLHESCNACDICKGNKVKVDITIDAQKIMSAISRTGQRFGMTHIIEIVVGAKTKRILELKHDTIKTYGVGKDKGKDYWRNIVNELLAQGFIYIEDEKYTVLKLSDSGKEVLFKSEKVFGLVVSESKADTQTQDKKGYSRVSKTVDDGTYDVILFQRLREVRAEIAKSQNVPPFIIFSDKTLHEMCIKYPSTLNELQNISGVGQIKLQRYGFVFLIEIKEYLTDNPDILVVKT